MDKFYSCEEVAKLFGVKKFTVWEWIREKKLGASRIGRNYIVSQDDIDEFYKKNRR